MLWSAAITAGIYDRRNGVDHHFAQQQPSRLNVRFVPLAEVGQLHSITSSAAVAFAERDYLNASSSIVG
jgi:hypothetical protein